MTILESYLEGDLEDGGYVYLDPDRRGLLLMDQTFAEDREKDPTVAYKKWRNASNYITNTLLNKAFAEGYNIAHGTTSTGASIKNLYQSLKSAGYTISLIVCAAPEEVRFQAVDYRNTIQKFVQSTSEDFFSKNQMFFERFSIYAQYADTIDFFWTDQFNAEKTPKIKVATWTKGKGLVILEENAFDKFKQHYEAHRKEGARSFYELFPLSKESRKIKGDNNV